MKLSADTIEVLKNFSKINENLKVSKGKKLNTINEAGNIYAEATIGDEFPADFALNEISQLLGSVALFKEPALEFDENELRIKSDNKKNVLRLVYAAVDTIVSPPGQLKFPATDITFDLSEGDLKNLTDAAKALKLENFTILAADGELSALVHTTRNSSSNQYKIYLDQQPALDFNLDLRVENLKLFPGDYKVSIAITGKIKCAIFEHKTYPIKYLLGGESTSKNGA